MANKTQQADPLEMLRLAWQKDPCLYAQDILKVVWWYKQQEIARNLVKYKKVFVKASHSVGKTHVAAGIVNWFFDSFPNSICITTAPSKQQVTDALWKEVRLQRKGRPGLMPKEPRMDNGDGWYALGMTATSEAAFSGRHAGAVLIIIDECVGVDADIWSAIKGMLTNATGEVYFLCICNPTDTSSHAYTECQRGTEFEPKPGQFKVMTISALDHPNIHAQLNGEEPPFPDAVGVSYVDTAIEEWTTPVDDGDQEPGDVFWRGFWYRPGPQFEGKVIGRWPSSTSDGVWNDVAWRAATTAKPHLWNDHDELVIGSDLAAGGQDFTTIMARRGLKVIHHETHNGWSAGQIAAAMKDLANNLSMPWENQRDVRLQLDHDAVGYSIVKDHSDGYNFITISGAGRSDQPDRYPNIRSQLWFSTAELASKGEVDLSALPHQVLSELERQLRAPKWRLDSAGRRMVEKKINTKQRIRRSPDDADALNILFYNPHADKLRLPRGSGIIKAKPIKARQRAVAKKYIQRTNVPGFMRSN